MILILDDDHEFVATVRDVLLKIGIEVFATTDPFEAIGILRTNKISKVVADFHMPSMDGIEFFENVKQINPKIKRIILTGYSDNAHLQKALSEEIVNSVAFKPIDRRGLIELIS